MIITAVLLAIILTGKIRSDAINHFIEDAVDSSSPRIARALTPADLEVAMTGERYERFHQFVQDSVVPERTARIKLWAKDGTVIYSDDPTQVGERFPNKLNLMKAFEGETPIEIKVPEDVDNDRERRLGTLVEVYVPIVHPGATTPNDAIEIYQYYASTAARMADGVQLQRVFLNLANNAQDAMPHGGRLTILARDINGHVAIHFIDSGEGISDEHLGKIFDPLFTTKIQGTGLGLAVCQEIITQHGGTILARRNEDSPSGMVFEVVLPARRPSREDPPHG